MQAELAAAYEKVGDQQGDPRKPSFRFFDLEGRWAVEGTGVDPDVEVIDRPDAMARGEDPTLEAAVKYLLEELRRNPPKRPTPPTPPVLKQ